MHFFLSVPFKYSETGTFQRKILKSENSFEKQRNCGLLKVLDVLFNQILESVIRGTLINKSHQVLVYTDNIQYYIDEE